MHITHSSPAAHCDSVQWQIIRSTALCCSSRSLEPMMCEAPRMIPSPLAVAASVHCETNGSSRSSVLQESQNVAVVRVGIGGHRVEVLLVAIERPRVWLLLEAASTWEVFEVGSNCIKRIQHHVMIARCLSPARQRDTISQNIPAATSR